MQQPHVPATDRLVDVSVEARQPDFEIGPASRYDLESNIALRHGRRTPI
jgi:hypothetical protein